MPSINEKHFLMQPMRTTNDVVQSLDTLTDDGADALQKVLHKDHLTAAQGVTYGPQQLHLARNYQLELSPPPAYAKKPGPYEITVDKASPTRVLPTFDARGDAESFWVVEQRAKVTVK